jgi:cell division protein ZapA (FtsZ GTPase activity inhibitor)
MNNLHSLKVMVAGEAVHVRSDQPAHVVERVAGYLNEKFQEAGRGAAGADKFRILALTALNVAGELFELQSKLEEYDKAKHRMLVQAKSLTETLDRAIAPAG